MGPPSSSPGQLAGAIHPRGVDYAGQPRFKVGSKVVQGALIVFTCLTTRAVHLELASATDVPNFLMALRRMANSKGTPKDVYSDNAAP